MKTYKHIFFDLDRTLYDLDSNSNEVLLHLYEKYNLKKLGVDDEQLFIERFNEINHHNWKMYGKGLMDKQTMRAIRFPKTLAHWHVEANDICDKMSAEYTQLTPMGSRLLPHARELLNHLHGTYKLHIISNGFEDIQQIKMKSANMLHYFDVIVTSDASGYTKPDKRIFEHALDRAGAQLHESIMVGDNFEIDILGAINAGMDNVFYHHGSDQNHEQITHRIASLQELFDFFK